MGHPLVALASVGINACPHYFLTAWGGVGPPALGAPAPPAAAGAPALAGALALPSAAGAAPAAPAAGASAPGLPPMGLERKWVTFPTTPLSRMTSGREDP